MPVGRFLKQLDLSVGKFYDWRKRYGKVNEHNGWVPRDFWLHAWEKEKILDFQTLYPNKGYRRLTYMMIDADIGAVSPASVWRVLSQAGRLKKWNQRPSKKGTGFVQPLAPHEHWHIDISYINIHSTFYYLCTVLDGASRYIVDWTLRELLVSAEAVTMAQTNSRLRNLLVERFLLKTREETKELPIYAITLGKNGHKLKSVDPGSGESMSVNQNNSSGTMRCTRVTLKSFADSLGNILGRPVVNETGLDCNFDFELTLSADLNSTADQSGPSSFTALQEQLGLKL